MDTAVRRSGFRAANLEDRQAGQSLRTSHTLTNPWVRQCFLIN